MKPLMTLGLAALAALMAMAFIIASSAMAEETALCAADEEPCSKGNLVTHVHESTLVGSPAILLNGVGNVACDVLFLSSSVGSPGAPQVIKGNFTYSNCLRNGTESCAVTEQNGPSEVKVFKEGHEAANVTGEGEVKVKCGTFIICTYGAEGLLGMAKGPLLSSETNGSVSIFEQATRPVSGILCPSNARLDITTTPLSAVYLGPGGESPGEQMVCIFVGANNGFYLGASGTTCTNEDVSRVGSYELGLATTNTAKTHVCALVTNGFYLSASKGTKCESQEFARVGLYELGITQ
jgi:hypothetical protein